jgi:hypothetical protein
MYVLHVRGGGAEAEEALRRRARGGAATFGEAALRMGRV